ncbi:MAG TPA: phosphoribosyl-ATP pyrophosphatase [Chryseobacterium sp.]|nr:phosphoribosyl-ATP pyrophosphatase [Chryseobacterium sp.]
MADYNNIMELRAQKNLLKGEIEGLEDILTFKDKKESLDILTHGFTDNIIKEHVNADGGTSLSLDTQYIMQQISQGIRESASKKKIVGLAKDSLSSGLLETTIKMGVVALVGNFAKKSVMNKNWKRKLIGLGMVYLAPYALRFIRQKLDNYQKNKATSSLEKLI